MKFDVASTMILCSWLFVSEHYRSDALYLILNNVVTYLDNLYC